VTAVDARWRRQRYEIKYLVRHDAVASIQARIGQYMTPDEHMNGDDGGYFNHSVYFDNPRLRFYLEKHEGMLERSKPRLRAYRPSASAPPIACFLELKNRADRLISKDRTPISRAFATSILAAPSPVSGDAFVSDPVLSKFYMLSKRFALRPQAAVLYRRRAYVSTLFPNLRITLDSGLQASWSASLDSAPSAFRYALPPNLMVLEIKYDRVVPKAVLRDIEALGLRQATFSKYAVCVEANAEARFNRLRTYLD
jgi:hypothetical protein